MLLLLKPKKLSEQKIATPELLMHNAEYLQWKIDVILNSKNSEQSAVIPIRRELGKKREVLL